MPKRRRRTAHTRRNPLAAEPGETETIVPDPISGGEPENPRASTPKPKNPAERVRMTPDGIMVENLNDLLRFADTLVRDGACPKGWGSGQVAIAIQAGLERGLGLLGGLTQGVVINGVFSWRGQAAVALIQTSGVCKPGTLRFGCSGEGDTLLGYAEGHRVGYAKPERREFSVKDARRAKLWGKAGPWSEHPERMLAWRAVGHLARDVFPDVLGGFALAEEQVDFRRDAKRESTIPGERPEVKPPPAHDPLMDVIADKKPPTTADVVDAELVCSHGLTQPCKACEAEDKAAILEAERGEAAES